MAAYHLKRVNLGFCHGIITVPPNLIELYGAYPEDHIPSGAGPSEALLKAAELAPLAVFNRLIEKGRLDLAEEVMEHTTY